MTERSRLLLALLLTLMPSVCLSQTSVLIEINNTVVATDDYLCWSPISARARLVGAAADTQITLRNAPNGAASGKIGFLSDLPASMAALNPVDTLQPTLKADGTWFDFYVLGRTPSTEDKDTSVVVVDGVGNEIGRISLMVRVRKNAESLSVAERDRFLIAFVRAANRNNQFAKYWGVHTDAINLAHAVAFLPWHRVFLSQLERELQLEDSSVSLPYWEFDKPAPKLFTEEFIGRVDSDSFDTLVRFTVGNPLSTWSLNDVNVSPLRRDHNGDTDVSAFLNKNFMGSPEHLLMNRRIFGPYHGAAHSHIGGMVGDINRSPADPLFFLLHANVDRAWAAWQRFYDRFDRTKVSHYGLQGSQPPNAELPMGNYVADTMWPWDGIARPTEIITMTTQPVTLPPNLGPGSGLTGTPLVGDTLDYLDSFRSGQAHGFCYDSVPFGVGPVDPFWHP